MRLVSISTVVLLVLWAAADVRPGPAPAPGSITGKVTLTGAPPKSKPPDLSKQPECVKLYPTGFPAQEVVIGPGNTLQNVVVYISAGDSSSAPAPKTPAAFDQQNCNYTTHILALRTGQDVSISNSDPFNHNIHPLAKINREWNRIQLPGTPPFTYSYDNEEFIHVKCNIHSWMGAYFVVLKTAHFSVTAYDGTFRLPELSPGKYTITAWHEVFGTRQQDVTLAAGDTQTVNFSFRASND